MAALASVSFDQEPSKDTLRRRLAGGGTGPSTPASAAGSVSGLVPGSAAAPGSVPGSAPAPASAPRLSASPSMVFSGSALPDSGRFVKTAWEGEVVDGLFHPLLPEGVAGSLAVRSEVALWTRFEAFRAAAERGVAEGNLPGALAEADAVFLRLRETSVIAGADVTLTITGRYVLCLDRATGAVRGAYRDDAGAPDQEIELKPIRGQHGYASGSVLVA